MLLKNLKILAEIFIYIFIVKSWKIWTWMKFDPGLKNFILRSWNSCINKNSYVCVSTFWLNFVWIFCFNFVWTLFQLRNYSSDSFNTIFVREFLFVIFWNTYSFILTTELFYYNNSEQNKEVWYFSWKVGLTSSD